MRDAAQARLRQLLGDPDRGVGDPVARVAQLSLGGLAGGVDAFTRGLARVRSARSRAAPIASLVASRASPRGSEP